MSTDASGSDSQVSAATDAGELGLEVSEADAVEQLQGNDGGPMDPDLHVPGSNPLDRISDLTDPVNPADAADQTLALDDEGYDERR